MAKIYKDFQDLVSTHQDLFDILGNKKKQSFYRAIWSSRDSEMEEYRSTIDRLREDYDSLQESLSLYENESMLFEEEKTRFVFELEKLKQAYEGSTRQAQDSYRDTLVPLEEGRTELLSHMAHLEKKGNEYLKSIGELQERNRSLYGEIESKKLYLKKLRTLYKKETNLFKEAHKKYEEKKRGYLLDINKLNVMLKDLREQLETLLSSNKKKDSYIQTLEKREQTRSKKNEELILKINDLQKNNAHLKAELSYQKELVYTLVQGTEERDIKIEELSSLLAESQKYSKQYKRINNKMSLEMDKMGREVEILKMAVN